MTLDQLRVFVAVADREHLSAGARAVNLTPPAATAAIQALEGRHGTKLFHRVGRRLELTEAGRVFVAEAKTVLNAARAAETALEELSGLRRGRLGIAASQTLASHWLPPILMRFATAHEGIVLDLTEGNTAGVAAAVVKGEVEIGCIEGAVEDPALAVVPLAEDRLIVVGDPRHPLARVKNVSAASLSASRWVVREPGSGTRAVLAAALADAGVPFESLSVTLTLSTNEAACAAVSGSLCLTAVSELVARPHIEAGRLHRIAYGLPRRRFALIRHKERFRSRAAAAFEALVLAEAEALRKRQTVPDYEI